MKFAPFLVALTLILSASCSNKKGKTNVQFGRMFLNGAPTFTGGLGIFGRNDSGSFFTYTLTDDSTIPPMEIPNGNWNFWAVGWTSANNLEGTTKCGTTSATLEGGDVGISMTLNQSNCGSSQLAAPAFINVDQFHPVVVTSCYLQTIVDDTTTCDSSYKGEHRSFRFKIDTISNFGPLPSPQPIISNCFDESSATSGSSTTTVTIPAGSAAGVPLNVIIEAFPNTGCSGTPEFFNMPKGFFGSGSQAKTFAGASQTKVYLDSLLPTAGPINSIAYMNLSHANITTAFVDISFDFLDDDNSNSTAVVQTCNITVSGAGCALAGPTAMTRGTSTYDKTFLSHSGSPGDEIKYNVVVTDPDGVSAALADQSFFVPVSAPTSLSFSSPASSPSNVASPVFNVNGTVAGGNVTLHYAADCSDAAQGSTAGAVTVTPVALSALTDGTYTIYAKQTINTVESACSSSSITYTVDTIAPTDPTALSFISPNPSNDNTPDVTASSLTVGEEIKFYTDSGCTALNVGPITITNTTETFALATLTDGAYTIYAKVFDTAGNSSTCMSVGAMTIDTVAPVAPSAITGTSPSNDTTADITVTHSDPTGIVSIYSDSGCSVFLGSSAANGSNVIVTSSILADGVYTVYANQADSAGNVSACSGSSFNYDLDTIAPTFLSFFVDDSVYYYEGDTVFIDVIFSENVTDSGSQLNLSGGRIANYSSGSGTNTLTYQYTVIQSDSDLDVDNANSPAVSGSVFDLAGNLASIATPTPGSPGSLYLDYVLVFLGHGKAMIGGAGADDNIKTAIDPLYGDVYTAMTTSSSIADTLSGTSDVYITRRSADGTLIDEVQLGVACGSWIPSCNSSGAEQISAIQFDDSTGTLYVVGTDTSGTFIPNAGSGTGTHVWVAAISFDPSYIAPPTFDDYGEYRLNGTQVAQALAVDSGSGNLAIAGYSNGAITCAYCSTGSGSGFVALNFSVSLADLSTPIAAWTFGGSGNDYATGVTFDGAGNIYIVGETDSTASGGSYMTQLTSLGGTDVYVWKFAMPSMSPPAFEYRLSSAGTNLNETPTGIDFDGTNFIVYGYTTGNAFTTNMGADDYFIMTLNPSLVLQNSYQNGTSGIDRVMDVTVDGFGNIYSAGTTTGALGGATNASSALDIFVQKFDPALTDQGTVQYDDNFALIYDSTTPVTPNSIQILDDALLVISATVSSGGDVFALGDAMGGTTDGALLMVRAP